MRLINISSEIIVKPCFKQEIAIKLAPYQHKSIDLTPTKNMMNIDIKKKTHHLN